MWQADRSAEAPGRLENLKELIRSMEDFEALRGFLEHVSLVMDTDNNASLDAVSLMTLHSAKGLEFETVFLPGWEEGLFPHQRALDEGGRSGLEEERRLAYVGITRATRAAATSGSPPTAASTACGSPPSPRASSTNCRPAHVEVLETGIVLWRLWLGARGRSLWRQPLRHVRPVHEHLFNARLAARPDPQPGRRRKQNWGTRSGPQTKARTIEGELVASSVAKHAIAPSTSATASSTSNSAMATSPPSTATS